MSSSQASAKRVRIRVEGVVQGVFFRASTQTRARALGLGGWVMNTRDGAVELEAQGPADAIAELVAWCHEGPPAARVTRVEARDLPLVEPRDSSFEIHR